MSQKNDKTISEDTPVIYPYLQPTSLKELYKDLLKTHYDFYHVDFDDTFSELQILTMILLDVPFFHSIMMTEILNCTDGASKIRSYLNRLMQTKDTTNCNVKVMNDNEIRLLYYITRNGYHKLVSTTGPTISKYDSKTGKTLTRTSLHDFGVAESLLAFYRSPYALDIAYELPTTFDKAVMPSGYKAHYKRSLRPDGVFKYREFRNNKSKGTIYIEHDTGNESLLIMISKIGEYFAHGLLSSSLNKEEVNGTYIQDAIIYTYRTKYTTRPLCFRLNALTRFVAAYPSDVTLDKYENDEDKEMIKSFSMWTAAIKKKWNKERLEQFVKDVREGTDKDLLAYFRYYQRKSASTRRKRTVDILIDAYNEGASNELYPAITEMLSGFPVFFNANNCLPNTLPAMFMPDYPQTIDWIKDTLKPYFGNMEYTYRHFTYPNSSGGKELCFSNIFKAETGEDVAVEYISGDLSALLRLYLVSNFTYDIRNFPFTYILLVDSIKDAITIIEQCNKDLKIGVDKFSHSERFEYAFLNIGGNYLYRVDSNNKEVRLKP